MADRVKKELEEKRAKLVELRRARDERKALLAQAEKGSTEPISSSRKDVNDLVESLINSTPRPTSPYTTSSRQTSYVNTNAPPSGVRASASGSTSTGSRPGTPAGGRTSRMSGDGAAGGSTSGVPARGHSALGQALDLDGRSSPSFMNNVDYVDHSAELYELPSKAKPPPVTYSKGIQTTSTSMSTSTSDLETDDEDGAGPSRPRKIRDGGNGRETEDEMRKRLLTEMEDERKSLERELKELKEKTDEARLAELSEDQRQAIYAAPDFSAFIEESTKIVQRALSDGYDYIKDYTIGIDGGFEGQKVKLFCTFSDDRWTKGRSVTDLDWSPKFPELAVASYNKNPSAPNDPDGIVAVWNLHLLERPEFIFHSPSDVLSVTFSPYHPTLIFGGSYSGQVLLWDTRAKHLPVLKTPLSAAGHTYPIYGMRMVGTQNANNLITSSTDGLVCSWLSDVLAQPQEALRMSAGAHNKTDEVSITCLDFPDSEPSTFWIGTEEGSVYQANRYDRASSKAGLNTEDIYRGHAGPVTGLHFHPSSGSIDFSDLFITSSVDWTVKLWRAKAGKPTSGVTSTSSKEQAERATAPIHSFEEADDYVFDVKWHPSHPAVFGSVDGNGKFDLWNLNQDVEVPVVSTQVCQRALNKLAWDRNPVSRKVGLGSSDGNLYVYDVADKLVQPRDNEWVEMQKTVQGLTVSRDQGGGLGTVELPSASGSRYKTSLI